MEYVQLEGIHIHEDGYAKFIELTLNNSGSFSYCAFIILNCTFERALTRSD